MTMLASTPAGDAYTFRELSWMYREAGLSQPTEHPIANSPHTIVMGRS
jgi:hypothetical protein